MCFASGSSVMVYSRNHFVLFAPGTDETGNTVEKTGLCVRSQNQTWEALSCTKFSRGGVLGTSTSDSGKISSNCLLRGQQSLYGLSQYRRRCRKVEIL